MVTPPHLPAVPSLVHSWHPVGQNLCARIHHPVRLSGSRKEEETWRDYPVPLDTNLAGTQITFYHGHWLELSHIATPRCKGD